MSLKCDVDDSLNVSMCRALDRAVNNMCGLSGGIFSVWRGLSGGIFSMRLVRWDIFSAAYPVVCYLCGLSSGVFSVRLIQWCVFCAVCPVGCFQ